MFQKLEPRNDEWNRRYKFTDANNSGFLIEFKNGIAFFGWIFSETIKFYTCEQSVFEKHFEITDEIVEYKFEAGAAITYLRYPIEK